MPKNSKKSYKKTKIIPVEVKYKHYKKETGIRNLWQFMENKKEENNRSYLVNLNLNKELKQKGKSINFIDFTNIDKCG